MENNEQEEKHLDFWRDEEPEDAILASPTPPSAIIIPVAGEESQEYKGRRGSSEQSERSLAILLGEEDFEFKSEQVFNPTFGVIEEVLAADQDVTAIAAQDSLIILGTSAGRILVLDVIATRFHQHWTQEREMISQIAITGNGFAALGRFGAATFLPFAAAPTGGTNPSLLGAIKGFKPFRIDFGLNPEEGHATALQIVHEKIEKQDLVVFVGTAAGKVIRYSQGFFTSQKVEWYAGPSPILDIQVLHGLLTFALYNQIFFRDLQTRQKICSIYFPSVPQSIKTLPFARIDRLRAPQSFWRFSKPRVALDRPTHKILGHFYSVKFNTIKIAELTSLAIARERQGHEEKKMKVIHTVKLDYVITGIAPLTNRATIVLLAYQEGELLRNGIEKTQPKVLILPDDGRAEILYTKPIEEKPVILRDESNNLIDFNDETDETLDADRTFMIKALRKSVVVDNKKREIRDFLYLVHPRSLVRLTEVDQEVRIKGLLGQGQVRKARELLRRARHQVSLETKVEVKQRYIMVLLEEKRYREAAQKCSAFSRDLSKLQRGFRPRSKKFLDSYSSIMTYKPPPIRDPSHAEAEQSAMKEAVAKNLGYIDLKDRWFDWINRFNKEQALNELVPYVPTDIPELNEAVYDSIIALLVQQRRFKAIADAIDRFPADRYSQDKLEFLMEESYNHDKLLAFQEDFNEARWKLASKMGSHNQALQLLLQLKSSHAFTYLRLHPEVRLNPKMIVDLLAISVPRTAQLVASHAPLQREEFLKEKRGVLTPDGSNFITYSDQLLPLRHNTLELTSEARFSTLEHDADQDEERQRKWAEEEVELAGLRQRPQFTVKGIVDELMLAEQEQQLHLFLHQMFKINPRLTLDFHNLQPKLYIKYNPKLLLDFLKATTRYDTSAVLELCKCKFMTLQVVYLLERLGDKRQMILTLIDMGDIHTALKKVVEADYFCEPELWDLVVNCCLSNHRYALLLRQLIHFKPSWTHLPSELVWSIPLDTSWAKIRRTSISVLGHLKRLTNIYEASNVVAREEYFSIPRKLTKGRAFGKVVMASHGQVIKRTSGFFEDYEESKEGEGSQDQRKLQPIRCLICEDRIQVFHKVVAFRCGHLFHHHCICEYYEGVNMKKQFAANAHNPEMMRFSFTRLCIQQKLKPVEFRCTLCFRHR